MNAARPSPASPTSDVAPGTLSIRERPAPPQAAGAAGGGGPRLPYLLVHGSMDRATSFRRLEGRLGDAAIVTYDRRGYAGSASRPVSEDFADQVADLLEVVAGRPVVALGHSFGGAVVLAAAQQRPDLIRAAVIWEPPMPWLPSWPAPGAGRVAIDGGRDPGDVAESFMRRMVGDRIWERLPAATRQARRREGVALMADMRSLCGPAAWDPPAVTVPVIVGTGGASREQQGHAARQLAGALRHADVAAVAGAGHGAHLSHPGELAALLRRAARLAAGSGPTGVGTVPDGAAESHGPVPDEESPT